MMSLLNSLSLGDTKVLGVVAEAIANNAAGRVITNGYVTTVTVRQLTLSWFIS